MSSQAVGGNKSRQRVDQGDRLKLSGAFSGAVHPQVHGATRVERCATALVASKRVRFSVRAERSFLNRRRRDLGADGDEAVHKRLFIATLILIQMFE